MNTPDPSSFTTYIPGFEFLQNLSRQAASSAAPGQASAAPGMPPLGHWVAPTMDVEEIERRIQDLRAVHFWLDQNTKALAATIQALEVQKMTLAALRRMNVSLQDMAEAFRIRPEEAQAPAAASDAATAAAAATAEPPPVDPMQWWSALTQQFQTIASGAIRDMAEHASRAAGQMAQSVQAGAEAMASTAPTAEGPAPAAAAKPRRRASTASPAPARATPPASGASKNTPSAAPRAGARRRRQP